MSLRWRLALLFVLIVVLPLACAGYLVQRVFVDELERRALLSLRPALRVAGVVYRERLQSVDQQVAVSANSAGLGRWLEARDSATLRRFLGDRLDPRGINFLIVVDEQGRVVTEVQERPDFIAGFETPSVQSIVASESPVERGFARTAPIHIESDGDSVGSIVGGFWIDGDVLVGSTEGRVELAAVVDGTIAASTHPLSGSRPLRTASSRFAVDIGGGGTAVAETIGGNTKLVAWAPALPIEDLASRFAGSWLALLGIALVVTAVLAYLLVRFIARPLTDLASGAKAIAEGRFDHRINVRSSGEVAQVAEAFNDMADHLEEVITQLQASRAQLQRAVQRVGELYRSTFDMDQIMTSILDTAADAVEADAAVLWRFNANRNELYPALTRGVGGEIPPVPVGVGVAGIVAERGAPVLKEPGAQGHRSPEPDFPATAAAAFHSQNRIQGVIACYRRDEHHAFSEEDLSTVVFLAEQGGVAIENVMLHEEAQRLSLTDGLTGTWNRRYFQMQFRQVLATAVRFERPFSVLMLDLDHFKRINDTFGHQRGDATLVEFSRRVTGVLREVDTFARYGGEEFISLLPETDYSGALVTAEKILDSVKAEPFGETGEQLAKLTVSIGVASYPIHGVSFSVLVEAADRALYRAKQEGRDRVVVAGEQPPNLSLAK
jgi:two-component system cell cycle response regulator